MGGFVFLEKGVSQPRESSSRIPSACECLRPCALFVCVWQVLGLPRDCPWWLSVSKKCHGSRLKYSKGS